MSSEGKPCSRRSPSLVRRYSRPENALSDFDRRLSTYRPRFQRLHWCKRLWRPMSPQTCISRVSGPRSSRTIAASVDDHSVPSSLRSLSSYGASRSSRSSLGTRSKIASGTSPIQSAAGLPNCTLWNRASPLAHRVQFVANLVICRAVSFRMLGAMVMSSRSLRTPQTSSSVGRYRGIGTTHTDALGNEAHVHQRANRDLAANSDQTTTCRGRRRDDAGGFQLAWNGVTNVGKSRFLVAYCPT